jgi:vacuolar-type H+-ATPase subunit I/STV1
MKHNQLVQLENLKTRINFHLQDTNFKDKELVNLSQSISDYLDQVEYEKLSEKDKETRKLFNQINKTTKNIDKLYKKIKEV